MEALDLQTKTVFSLEVFIENFKDQTPDPVEHRLLYSLYESVGFHRTYTSKVFELPSSGKVHKLAIANYLHQAKNKLDLLKCIEFYGSLMLTHSNDEVRKFPVLLMGSLEEQAQDLFDAIQKCKDRLIAYVAALEVQDKLELRKLVKVDYNKACMQVVNDKEFAILAGTQVVFDDKTVTFEKDTVVKIPRPKKGSDYQVVVTKSGKVVVNKDNDLASDTSDSLLIGGFHYAPGGNADDKRQGGDENPQINPCSIWDLAWRPMASDPRSMTLIENEFWCDIYPMTEDGKNTYGEKVRTNIDWWETNETIANQGKRCPSEEQFQKLAFGTTENKSSGNKIEKASLAAPFTSKWGVMMSTGCYYVWGNPFTIPEPTDDINTTLKG